MVGNFTVTRFSDGSTCLLPYTPIYDIQGSGPTAAITGTRDDAGCRRRRLRYREAARRARPFAASSSRTSRGTADPATSDGIFVFNGNNNTVSLGDVVRVRGTAGGVPGPDPDQRHQRSRTAGPASVAPVDVTLPVRLGGLSSSSTRGCSSACPQTLYVTEHFQLGRFGQVRAVVRWPAPAADERGRARARPRSPSRRRTTSTGSSSTTPRRRRTPTRSCSGAAATRSRPRNTLRGGDTATGIVGVMTYTWAGNAASGNAYRVRPINALGGYVNFEPTNPRPAVRARRRRARCKVVGHEPAQLLQHVRRLPKLHANGVGGAPTDCRGADDATEFARQWPKTVAAILALESRRPRRHRDGERRLRPGQRDRDARRPAQCGHRSRHLRLRRRRRRDRPGQRPRHRCDQGRHDLQAGERDPGRPDGGAEHASRSSTAATATLRNRPALAQAFEENANGRPLHRRRQPPQEQGQRLRRAGRRRRAGQLQRGPRQRRDRARWPGSRATRPGPATRTSSSSATTTPTRWKTRSRSSGTPAITNLVEHVRRRPTPTRTSSTASGATSTTRSRQPSLARQVTGAGEYHVNADEPSVLDLQHRVQVGRAADLALRARRVPHLRPRPDGRRPRPLHAPGRATARSMRGSA